MVEGYRFSQRWKGRYNLDIWLFNSPCPLYHFHLTLSVQLNSFQAVMAMDGVTSYILFLYKDLQWTTSDACPSSLPEAGISAGDGVRSTTLPSSGTTNIVSLTQTSSAGVPGLHILSSSGGM